MSEVAQVRVGDARTGQLGCERRPRQSRLAALGADAHVDQGHTQLARGLQGLLAHGAHDGQALAGHHLGQFEAGELVPHAVTKDLRQPFLGVALVAAGGPEELGSKAEFEKYGANRIAEGKLPACAEMCATKALLAGDGDVLEDIYRKRVMRRAGRPETWGWEKAYGAGV
jgi:hypothetical protein